MASTKQLAAKIDRFLQSQGSPLAGQGINFVRSGRRYGVDPLLLVAISGQESSFGKNSYRPHNAWGWGGMTFDSWAEGIETVARGLRSGYLDDGLTTIAAIGARYAPIGAGNDPTNLNSGWVSGVTKFYSQLGGTDIESDTGDVPAATRGGGKVLAVLNWAMGQLGQPYVWGGDSRDEGGFDCSGLIYAAYGALGISIPRVTYDVAKAGREVSVDEIQPGDVVITNNGHHEVLYIGGGKVLAASGNQDGSAGAMKVVVQDLSQHQVVTVRRFVDAVVPDDILDNPAAVETPASATGPVIEDTVPTIAAPSNVSAQIMQPAQRQSTGVTFPGVVPVAAPSMEPDPVQTWQLLASKPDSSPEARQIASMLNLDL